MTFYGLFPFTLFATTATTAAFSQGTADALKTNLAVNLKPYFASAQIDPVIVEKAELSKEFLRTTGVLSRAMLKRSPSQIGKPAGPPTQAPPLRA